MRVRIVTAVGIAALMLACGGVALASARTQPAAPRHHSYGTVTGTYEMEGGPIPGPGKQPPIRPLSGTITFRAQGSPPVRVHANASGRFTVRLAVGTYRITARSGAIRGPGLNSCVRPDTVTVRPRHISHLTLVCIVP